MKSLRERLVPVPQDVLFTRLRERLVSGVIGSLKNLEAQEPVSIECKISKYYYFVSLSIIFLPRNGWCKLKYNLNLQKCFLWALSIFMLVMAVTAVLAITYVIPYPYSELVAEVIGAIGMILILPVAIFENKFYIQFEQLIQNIELNHEHETQKE